MERNGHRSEPRRIFIAGSTGYLGSALIPRLLARGHAVTALVRPQSIRTPPSGCRVVLGNPLDRSTFEEQVRGADTFLQLVGVPKPSPWKGPEFRAVDLVSTMASVEAARTAGVHHFVYVSVAHPAPVMKAYIEVRVACESLIRAGGLRATVLRPWYILGPGHWWPVGLLPLYWCMGRLPMYRDAAARLGLITLAQMLRALVWAIEHPPSELQVIDVPRIRMLDR